MHRSISAASINICVGSADSTRHSPQPLFGDRTIQNPEATVRILSHATAPFSPTDLSLRLNTISPKPSPAPFEEPLENGLVAADDAVLPSATESSIVSSTASPTTNADKWQDIDQEDAQDKIPSPQPIRPQEATFISEPLTLEEPTFDDGFAQTVKGLFHMWSSGRGTQAERNQTRQDFVEDIRKVLDTL